jgi:hypothetical protein
VSSIVDAIAINCLHGNKVLRPSLCIGALN